MFFDGRLLGGIGVLAAVVESGNFARAGEALGLTSSGVSRAVTLTDEGRGDTQSALGGLVGADASAIAAAEPDVVDHQQRRLWWGIGRRHIQPQRQRAGEQQYFL